MPLTPAHPAAVLPLQRTGLPLSALVAGAMAPDVVLLAGDWGYQTTHSALGVVTVDVVIAVSGLALWFAVLRDPLADLTPYVRDRVPVRARPPRRAWLLAPVAAAAGAATHVLWDSATHEGRLIAARVSLLEQDLGPLPGYAWAQQVSTVAGTAVVVTWVVLRLRSMPARRRALPPRIPSWWLLLPPLLAVAVAPAAPHTVAAALLGLAAGLLLLALAWWRSGARTSQPA
jgi:hypothetical protein